MTVHPDPFFQPCAQEVRLREIASTAGAQEHNAFYTGQSEE
jgi:hypothetical protein